jgi:ribosomal-protein-serine acetyltransferase
MSIEIARGPLLIRSWQLSDADALARAVADNLAHIRPWLPWALDLPDDPAGIAASMTSWLADAVAGEAEDDGLIVGLFLDGAVAGGAGLHDRIGPDGLEIGYWVHRDYLRRGLATTASRALTDHAFARPGIDRVEIHHDRANVASEGVPRTLGFSRVGEEVRAPTTPQQTGVQVIWRVTRADWPGPDGP